MAQQETIREFLVSLGFKVNEDQQKKFANQIGFATAKFAALGLVAEKAIASVSHSIALFVNDMESLFFASQRTNATVAGIMALENAGQALGASAQEMRGSLESVASFMRNIPGGESFIQGLGVQTRDANGQLRKTEEIMIDLGKRFAKMPWVQGKVRADVLGINENTFRAIRSGEFESKFRAAQARLGDGYDEAAKKSQQFAEKVRAVKQQFAALFVELETQIITKLLPVLDKVSAWLSTDAGPLIKKFADGVVAAWNAIGNALDQVDLGDLPQQLLKLFDELLKLVKSVGSALADAFGPTLVAAMQGAVDAVRFLVDSLKIIKDLVTLDDEKLAEDSEHARGIVGKTLDRLSGMAGGVADKFLNFTGGIAEKIVPESMRGVLNPTHYLGNTHGNSSSSSIEQKTNINVYGSNAQDAAQSVAREQDRVNQRMMRNFIATGVRG